MSHSFRACRLQPAPEFRSEFWGRNALLKLLKRRARGKTHFIEKLTQISDQTYKLERASSGDLAANIREMMCCLQSTYSFDRFVIYNDDRHVKAPLVLHLPLPTIFFRLPDSPSVTHIDLVVASRAGWTVGVPWHKNDYYDLLSMFSQGRGPRQKIEYHPISHPALAEFSPTLPVNRVVWAYWQKNRCEYDIRNNDEGKQKLSLREALIPRVAESEFHSVTIALKIKRPKLRVTKLHIGDHFSIFLEMVSSNRMQAQARAIETEMALLALDIAPSLFEKNPDSQWQFLR